MVTLLRMFQYGAQNFWRNLWLSLNTVLNLTLNLFLISVVVGLLVLGQQTLTAVKQKVSLSVYFTSSTSEERVADIRQELLKKPEVGRVEIISRAERLKRLQATQGQSGLVNAAIEALGENPLGPGLIISAKTLDGYQPIVTYLKDPAYNSIIEETGNEFASNQKVIDRLTGIVSRLQAAAIALTIVFAAIAVMMVFNAIRVTIYAHREEISIMKLVGASDALVRGPFIVTSLLYGVTAAVITVAVITPILTIANPFLSQFFAGYDLNILDVFRQNILVIIAGELVISCCLAMISSIFAIGRYLRV